MMIDRAPFWLLAAAHLVGCLYYFPPREIFSGEPLLTGDYVQRYLEAARVAEYLHGGSFLGYSTRWSAGFVDGLTGLLNNKPLSLLLALVPTAFRPVAFNLAVLLALWLFPPLIHAASRRFGHTRSEAAVAMALSMACWYGSMLCRVFWRGGSVLFFVGTGAALWAGAVLFARWREEADGPRWPLLVFAVVLVPWVHAGAVLVFAVIGFLAYALTIRRGIRAGELFLLATVSLVANAAWLWPFLRHRHLLRSMDFGIYPGGLSNFVFDFIRGPLHLGAGPREEAAILAPLAVLAALGLAKLESRGRLASLLALSAAAFAILAYGGSSIGMTAAQPYRFAIPLSGILSIAAGGALGWRGELRLARRIAVALAAAVALIVVADRVRIASRASDYLGAGLGATETWALEQLRAAAAPNGGRIEGRVLLEGDWFAEPVPERPSARRVSYSFVGFEAKIDGEFIGAPTMATVVREGAAAFWRGRLFGQELGRYESDSFLRLAQTYDIRWAVTLHERSKLVLASFAPRVALLAERGGVGIFRIDGPKSDSRATSDGRTIEVVTGAEPMVIPYHWNPYLFAEPAAQLRPSPSGILPELELIEITAPEPGRHRIGAFD
ncbi:MAG: hypothetical protein ACREQJ_01720 [Candidatus Binatia bacterium]